jgi:hypothetical protein
MAVRDGQADPFDGIKTGEPFADQIPGLVGWYKAYGHLLLMSRVWRSHPDRRGRWIALGVVALGMDFNLYRRLARSGGPGWRTRMFADAADAALWAGAAVADPVSTRGTVLGAVPTSMEAGFYAGSEGLTGGSLMRALSPGLLLVTVQAWVRRRRDWKSGWGQLGWSVIAAAAGVGLGRNRKALRDRTRESWRGYAGERVEAAWWRAQHDLNMAEGDPRSPHNLKKDLLVLEANGSVRARQARDRFTDRKLEVVDLTRPFGTYLGDAASGLTIVPQDCWQIRLTPAQARVFKQELGDVLAAGRRPGTSEPLIVLDELEARRPGGAIRLQFGERKLVLPAATPPVRWAGDPAPLAFMLGAVWKLATQMVEGGPPGAFVVPFAAVDLLAASAYRKASPVGDDIARPVRVAVVTNVAYSIACASWCRRHPMINGMGELVYPGMEGAATLSLIATRYWGDLSDEMKLTCSLALAAIALISASTRKPGLSRLSFVDELMTMAWPLLAGTSIAPSLTADAARVWSGHQQRATELIDDAYQSGIRNECHYLAELIDDAEDALEELAEGLNPLDRGTIAQSYKEAREWLNEKLASLSSKTD